MSQANRVEYPIAKEHIDAMAELFTKHFKDPNCKQSGLVKAIRDNEEAAWVCGSEGKERSLCYEEFMARGHECIAVAAKYE